MGSLLCLTFKNSIIMSTTHFVQGQKHNVFTAIESKVVSVKLLKTYLKRELGDSNVVCTGYLVQDGNGKDYQLPADTKFYSSETHLKDNVPIATTTSTFWAATGANGYYFDGVQAKNGHIKDLLEEFAVNQDCSIEVIKGCMPTFCRSSEECYAYNDYTVRLEDGSEETREGTHKALLLTDEQKAILEEYKAIRKKMQDANMLIIFDNDAWTSYIINTTNVETVEDRGVSGEGVELFFSKEHEIPSPWDMCGCEGFGVNFK